MEKVDLLTIGDCSMDLFMKIESKAVAPEHGDDPGHPMVCFYHGTKIPVDDFETSIAGNALNIAYGARKLGIKSAIYSEIGDDSNADLMISELKKIGVDTTFLLKNKNTATDVHTVIVYAGERTIFSYHGKRDYKIRDWPKPKFIYYTSMGKGFEKFQKKLINYLSKNSDIGLAFNPGTMQMKAGTKALKDILSITDILLVNKDEAEKLTGGKFTDDDPIKNLHLKLHKAGPKLTVITDGKKEASAFDGTDYFIQKTYSDERPLKDKTGAGDAFSTGFLSAIIYGKPLQEALRWGVANSGCVIKEIGAINGLLVKNEVEKISKTLDT